MYKVISPPPHICSYGFMEDNDFQRHVVIMCLSSKFLPQRHMRKNWCWRGTYGDNILEDDATQGDIDRKLRYAAKSVRTHMQNDHGM